MKIDQLFLKEHIPLLLLILSTAGSIAANLYTVQSGSVNHLQNLFYIPIIIACVLYVRRGLLFSSLLSLIYLGLMIGYIRESTILFQECIRVILFVSIAIVITLLIEAGKKSEESLYLINEFQENIISGARVWLMVLDNHGTILLWNTAAEEISGYPAEEITGNRRIWRLLYPEKEYRRQITKTITRIINEKKYLENFETTINTRGGENKVISWNTKGVPDHTGVISKFIAIGVDVTDQHLAEQKLQKSEERFRQLFLENVAGYALHEIICDSSGSPVDYRFLEVNPAFERITGLKVEDIIGKKVLDVLPNTESYWIETYGKVALTGTSTHYENFSRELDRYYEVTAYSPAHGQFATLVLDITDRKRAELALQESEERLRLTLDATNDGVWDWDISTGSTVFSSRWYTMLGYDPAELPAHFTTWESLIHPDDLVLAEQRIRDHIDRKDEGYVVEVRMHTKEGGYKWILTRGKVVEWDDNGKPVRMVGTHTDISERKQIQEELAKKHFELLASYEQLAAGEEELKRNLDELALSEQLLRTSEDRLIMAQEIGHLGSWEYIRETGQIWASAEGFRIFGYPPVAGDIDLEKIESCIPERDRVHQALVDLISRGYEYNLEFAINPADGSSPKIIHSIAIFERDEQGTPLKVMGVIQDITNLKKNEEVLRETNAYLENLINLANVPIIVWDPEFQITRLNRACELLTGRKAEDVIGHSLEILFPPAQVDRSMRLIRTTLEGVRWETVELGIQHVDGSIRTIVWNSSTIYSPDGFTPLVTIAQGRDVTDQRRLEEERVVALGQIKQNLAQLSILNDEVRNPLTVITLNAENIGDRKISDQIIRQTRQIDDMIHQLDIRWIESEKVLGFLKRHHQVSFEEGSLYRKPEESDENTSCIPEGETGSILVQEVQAEFYTILDSIDATVYVADMNTHELLFMNRRGRGLFGDIIGKKCYETVRQDQHEPCPFCTNEFLQIQPDPAGVYKWEFYNTKNDRWYDCRDRAIRWVDGRKVRVEIATDITEWKKTEEQLRNITHLYSLLSQINHTIVQTRDKEVLFLTICQVAIESGGFTMAWIGLYDETENRIKPVCHAGNEAGYLDLIRITTGDTATGQGPTGLAYSEGAIMISYDIATEPMMFPWREEALKRGYRSSAAVPIRQKGIVIGVFTLYATEPEFFTADERSLLVRIGEEISFALDTIDLENEKKKVEEMLALKSEDLDQRIHLINALLETVPIGIFMVEVPSGRPLLSNREAMRLLGRDVLPDATEANLSDEYKAYKVGTSDRYPTDEMPIVRGMRGEKSYIDDMEIVRPDGTRINLEVFGNPVIDSQGRIFASLVCFIDISERKRVELVLSESEVKHRVLVEEISDPFFSLSPEGQYMFANQALADAFGRPVEEIVGRTIWDFFPKEEADRRFASLKDVLLTGKKKIIEGPVPSEEGTRYYATTITPIKDNSGRVLYAICSSKNITNRKQMEEALQEAVKKFHLLTGITRHDLFNQLTVIRGYQNLAIEDSDLMKVHTFISRTLEVCNQLEATIQFTAAYEDFGIVSSGWQQVHTTIESAKTEVSLRDVMIQNQIPDDLEVYADPVIRKVFTTLLENAVRHGGDLTYIRFSCYEHEDTLFIVCEDDGVGIPAIEKEKIFNNGYGKHNGIGLFLAGEILSITGLSVRERGEEGKGARFEIVVPKGKFRSGR